MSCLRSQQCARAIRSVGLPIFVVLCVLGAAKADSEFAAPVHELVGKIVSVTGPGTVALEVTNRSTLTATRVAAIRSAMVVELTSGGVRVAEETAATVNVTLSENIREYIWAAQIRRATDQYDVVLVRVARAESSAVVSAAVQIREEFLRSQEDRILDVAMIGAGGSLRMVVLDSAKVTSYKLDGGHWQKEMDWAVPHSQPWPRDLRGRLVPGRDQVLHAYLPGVFCSVVSLEPTALKCDDRDEPWPMDSDTKASLSPLRNFFTGFVTSVAGKYTTVPAFYSAAWLPRGTGLRLVATTDGTVHSVGGLSDQVWRGIAWGSDIASVHTGCGSGWQVIADGNKNAKRKDLNDELRVYEVTDQEAKAASAALSLDGQVTALWASGDSEALVVIRKEEAGRYEAHRLLFACGN